MSACVSDSMMASSLLRSTSDFLETGIDECLNQLYNCADMQSPDSSYNSDTSRLSCNTHAAFERRFESKRQPYSMRTCLVMN